MRNTKDFENPNTYIASYLWLVRTTIIYASTVWNPNYNVHSNDIERVQHRFCRSYSYRFGTPMQINKHNY